MASSTLETAPHTVVSHAEWLEARKQFLAKEKEFTRQRDELSRLRREPPWESVGKEYVFEGPTGKITLGELFDGRGQLIVYHFMLGPGWQAGCPSCSYLGDHFDGMTVHLANRDTTLAVISHAPYAEIAAFQKRMGWKFFWVSSFGTDFNYDYHVSFTPEEMAAGEMEYNYKRMKFGCEEAPGASVFAKDEAGKIFHSYSTYERGLDMLVGTYHFLDLTPKGRDEEGLVPHSMAWVRHHDRYEQGYFAGAQPAQPAAGSCCSGK